jgi:hypothetical protein
VSKPSGVSSQLDALMKKLMTEASKSESSMTLKDKLAILDRGLKLEAIKAKFKEDEFGKDFDLPGDEGQDE